MKNLNLTLFLSYSVIAGLIAFSGCIPKKEILPRSGTFTFYGYYSDNIGSITVTVDGTNVKTFSNTSDYCSYGSGYSSYFYTLSVGTHTYTALSDDQTKYWTGSFEVYYNTCNSKQLYASSSTSNPALGPTGTFSFYSNYSDYLGTITVTVDGYLVKSFDNTSNYCNYGSSYSSYLYTLTTGSHTFKAQNSDLTKTWNGSFAVSTGSCGSLQFTANNTGNLSSNTGTYSFYSYSYDNLGTINVTVDGINVKSFSNTSSYCGYGSSYSSYLYTLTTGSHTYYAKTSDQSKSWSGSFTISSGSCDSYQFTSYNAISTTGSYTFYTNYYDYLGTVTVTVDGTNIKTFSNTTDYCGYSGYSSYFFSLSPGSHSYVAKNSTRTWSGNFSVTLGTCGSTQLSASTGTLITVTTPGGGATGSNTITDSGGLSIYLSWTVPGSTNPTTDSDLDMQIQYSSGTSYSSATGSTFETLNFPTSGNSLSSIADGTYYISIKPYYISSTYGSASYSVKFTGNNTATTYTYNSTTPLYYYNASSSASYAKFIKIVKSGTSFTLSLY